MKYQTGVAILFQHYGDILGLDNIGVINGTCKMLGIDRLTPDNTDLNDMDVWKSIRDDTTLIFQWESSSAQQYLKQFMSDKTVSIARSKIPNFSMLKWLSFGNGLIRPSCASFRDSVAMGEYYDNGFKELNDFLLPEAGRIAMQETIMQFLVKFCGYSAAESDIVRRAIAKKKGTETLLPEIEKRFIEYSSTHYDITKERCEEVIKPFLQIVLDASDYGFSWNHSDAYSAVGYICGYLRYYYPLEFVTTALNIFEDKDDKTLEIIGYAKRHGIRILPIKFRHSTAQYSCNKDTNEIFKGISSIKYMNALVANEMYELRNNEYGSFVDLLYDLEEKTSLNSRQLRILIDLDFFEEFGDANYLIKCVELFDTFDGKRQIKKQKLQELGIDEDVVRPYAGKETDKMFTGVNMRPLIKKLASVAHYKKYTLGDRIRAQLTHLGYLDIARPEYSGLAVVLNLETKFSPRVKLHSLKNGTTLECKISKRAFNREKIKVGDIIRVTKSPMRSKMRRTDEGTFEPIPGQFERWIEEYRKVEI